MSLSRTRNRLWWARSRCETWTFRRRWLYASPGTTGRASRIYSAHSRGPMDPQPVPTSSSIHSHSRSRCRHPRSVWNSAYAIDRTTRNTGTTIMYVQNENVKCILSQNLTVLVLYRARTIRSASVPPSTIMPSRHMIRIRIRTRIAAPVSRCDPHWPMHLPRHISSRIAGTRSRIRRIGRSISDKR